MALDPAHTPEGAAFRSSSFDGITAVALPVGANSVGTVNMYVLADGDRATVVDCGVWHPALPDGGLNAFTDGIHQAGYGIGDVSRLILTHAHIDHYGLAGAILEKTGAELWMHAMTDRDCENYRHPETSRSKHRDLYADHGVPDDTDYELADHLTRWLPYVSSVVEASHRVRGGELTRIGGDEWELIHTPGHSYGHLCLWSRDRGVVISGDHLLPGVMPPVTFQRGFDPDPMRSYLGSLEAIRMRAPTLVLPGHGRAFGDAVGRIDAVARNKVRRLDRIRRLVMQAPCTVGMLTERLVGSGTAPHQRELAVDELFAHIVYLRHAGLIERRVGRDGIYEWFSTGDGPLDVAGLLRR